MTLSGSRQQFLSYETHSPEDIQYGRRGGIFISTCICVSFIVSAVVIAVLTGVIVYFITYFKLSQTNSSFWDDKEPFGSDSSPSPDLRLPQHVMPSFYRLKLITNLDNSTFSGEVYITLRASKQVKEIILHSKDLSINSNPKLTEQIYEKVETLHSVKIKREAILTNLNVTEISNSTIEPTLNGTTQPTQFNGTSSVTTIQPSSIASNDTNLTVDTQVTHSNVQNIKILSTHKGPGDRFILKLASALKPGVDYILELSFEGRITNSLTGFYQSSYVTADHEIKRLGVTQFEPISARAAFPCFDEPAYKSKFEISIGHPQNISALSNMKVSAHENIPEKPGWQWTHFERSVNMSTYLVAFVLSNFQSLETSYVSKDNITKTIKIWMRPELVSKAKYALTITPKLLEFYEDVFGVPYALDKLDLIAIPDFSSGAMENWGLITFRETALLYDEESGVPRDKQNIAIDVAHELAHQWFGNLVTMKWWTDLWLNEGFATYIEYVGVDNIEPAWNMFESFTRDKMELLRSDALKNTSPVSRQVIDASEISQKFDEISYTKGANLIRMLNHTLSADLFHKGLLLYLNEWKYANAEENDLWEAMSKATKSDPLLNDLSVVEFMNTWTKQAGYPVVNVVRNYDTGEVAFEQKLFTSSKDPYQERLNQLWHIPVSYTNMETPVNTWSTLPKIWLKEKKKTTHIPLNQTDALYVNVDAIGYYRVNYDIKNWELLSKALKTGQVKSPITKAQLIDDAFNLAKTSQLDYTYALQLATCVIDGDDSQIVWELLLNNMLFMKINLQATSGYFYFQDFVKLLIAKQLERLNYGLDKPKNDNEAFLIENLVMWDCMVESQRCLNWAKGEFEKWMNQTDVNNNTIPSYLRSLVYGIALKHGGRREFEFLWNLFHNTSDPNTRSLIVEALPYTMEESLITLLLEKSLTDIPKQYAGSVWNVSPPIGTRIAQNFIVENFDRVHEVFSQMDAFMLSSVLNGAFATITSMDELDTLKSLILNHKEKLLPFSQTLQKLIDSGNLKINWIKQHAAIINKWLKDYMTGIQTKNITDTHITTSTSTQRTLTSPSPAPNNFLNTTNTTNATEIVNITSTPPTTTS